MQHAIVCWCTNRPETDTFLCLFVQICNVQMGALDGVRFSNTLWYHKHLAWRGILIEADPVSYASLTTNRPYDVCVHAAVCHERQTVHYVQATDGAVSGIVE